MDTSTIKHITVQDCNPDHINSVMRNSPLERMGFDNTVCFQPWLFITIPGIKNVIFNKPATIVFWEDGDKTVVKCDKEKYDPEKGLVMAIAKKALGNQGNYYEVIKKWVGEERLFGKKKAEESEKKAVKKAEKKNKK